MLSGLHNEDTLLINLYENDTECFSMLYADTIFFYNTPSCSKISHNDKTKPWLCLHTRCKQLVNFQERLWSWLHIEKVNNVCINM